MANGCIGFQGHNFQKPLYILRDRSISSKFLLCLIQMARSKNIYRNVLRIAQGRERAEKKSYITDNVDVHQHCSQVGVDSVIVLISSLCYDIVSFG